MRSADADRESVKPVVGFCPPSIQNGKVQTAVQYDLLSARSRCFERAARRIQPYIHSLDEVLSDVDVIVLNENQPV